MDTSNAAVALLGTPDVNDVHIETLGFHGWFASSPSGQWRIAVESSPTNGQPVRWALLQGTTVHATGSAETEQVFAAAVADDATFVLARQTGRQETKVEVREIDGGMRFSVPIEALANACVISKSGRWVAVSFEESKRGDEPVVLIDADRRKLVWRKIGTGGAVLSVDEGRRLVVAEGKEFEFGDDPPADNDSRSAVLFNADSSSGWKPLPADEKPSFLSSGSPWPKIGTVLVGIFVLWFVGNALAGWLFVTSAPKVIDKLEKNVAKDLVDQYEMAKRHGSKPDICRKASEVADFYLSIHDEPAYARWKRQQKKDCEKAGN